MKFTTSFTFGFLTKEAIHSEKESLRFLDLIGRRLPKFEPEYIGSFEPLKKEYSSARDVFEFWGESFLWKRKKAVKSSGAVWFNPKGSHSACIINTTDKKIPESDVIAFLVEAAEMFKIDFGYAHLTTQNEVDVTEYQQWHPLDLGVSSFDLRKGVPNLPWFTVFGQPYLSQFGCDRLLSSSAYESRKISENHVSLKVVEDLGKISCDYPSFESLRINIREELGPMFAGNDRLIVPSDI